MIGNTVKTHIRWDIVNDCDGYDAVISYETLTMARVEYNIDSANNNFININLLCGEKVMVSISAYKYCGKGKVSSYVTTHIFATPDRPAIPSPTNVQATFYV